jgi:hypothetical protein
MEHGKPYNIQKLSGSITHHQRWENPHKNPNLPETHDLIHLHDHHSLPMQLGALDD